MLYGKFFLAAGVDQRGVDVHGAAALDFEPGLAHLVNLQPYIVLRRVPVVLRVRHEPRFFPLPIAFNLHLQLQTVVLHVDCGRQDTYACRHF